MNRRIFLTIAGSDPSGGAGIQADIRTAIAHGLYPCSVITAITAQNTSKFEGSWAVDPDTIEAQLRSVLSDIRPDAVKIGMLPNAEAVKRVADLIREFELFNVVLDPMLSPTLSSSEPDKNLVGALCKDMLPVATVVTPNVAEMELLEKACGESLDEVCPAVLVTAGHTEGKNIVDRLLLNVHASNPDNSPSTAFPTINFNHSALYDFNKILPNEEGIGESKVEVVEFTHPRIDSENTHGTGCILSSAIACNLANGYILEKAVKNAINFTEEALRKAKDFKLGKGNYGPALI